MSYPLVRQIFNFLFFAQFFLALPIYFYFALKTSGPQGGVAIAPLVLHCGGNIVLTLSCFIALGKKLPYSVLVAGLFACAFLAELGQLWVPSRVFDIPDLAANFLGVAIGLFFVSFSRSLSKKLADALLR